MIALVIGAFQLNIYETSISDIFDEVMEGGDDLADSSLAGFLHLSNLI